MEFSATNPQSLKKDISKEEGKWLKTDKLISKSDVLSIGYEHAFGLLSWNYKHDTTKAGKGGSDLTKKAAESLLDDVSIDIFAMQELLWTHGTERHIRRQNDKFGEITETFKVISTGKESGFYFNSSQLMAEKVNHVKVETIEKNTFEGVWNTRTCICKFTCTTTGLVFHVVTYHGPNKVGDLKKEEFAFNFFKRVQEFQNEGQDQTPFFIAGDFNLNIQESKKIEKIPGLAIAYPHDSQLEGAPTKTKDVIDFVSVFNAKNSKWKGNLFGTDYERVEHYQGVSTHPPIFTYLAFRKSTKN
jgi:endonuclease/exonuclease/phosphatase family metal-dependent hydrolase